MSYTTDRIKRRLAESEEFRAAYQRQLDEEKEELERREALMSVLAKARKEAHLTQQEVAQKMKVSQARISQLERGKETLSVDRFLELLNHLKVKLLIVPDEEVPSDLKKRVVAPQAKQAKAIKIQSPTEIKNVGKSRDEIPVKKGVVKRVASNPKEPA